ncbi:hypothetical protein [Thiosulfatihalobacter marinus]|uniref:hypothetical protein n=1 Tax=Thiosulfatihalobacter marinus TaxID=2792481 RepID=UPI0018D9FA27|nr:hypothetical protein [Thiosulfatihalobacter marinus]
MRAEFSIAGLREIDNVLAALPKATSKAVVKRALRNQLLPVADMANGFWPGADDDVFQVSLKLKSGQPRPDVPQSAVTMFVGTSKRQAHLLEWGTAPRYHKSGKYVGAVAPQPMLTPSWEAHKDNILNGLVDELRREIDATIARRARRGL